MPPRASGSPAESGWGNELAAGVAITVTVIAGITHLAALVAARVFGTGNLPATVGDSARALLRLPSHASDPANAWPAPAAVTLPGAVALWSCLIGAGLIATGIAAGAWWLWRRVSGERHPLGVKEHAGLAAAHDIDRLRVRSAEPGRLTLGRVGRALVAAEPQTSLAVVGPTGCGKTAGFAIPALLEWSGPVIATSVKADLLAATITHRAKRGKVWVYDPTGSANVGKTAGWSPLSTCGTWPGALRMAAWLCEAAQPRLDTLADGDYWYSLARKGLAPYLYGAAASERSVRDLVRWVDAGETSEVEFALKHACGLDAAIESAMATPEATARKDRRRPEVRAETIEAIRDALRDRVGGRTSWANRSVPSWPVEMQEQLDGRVEAELDAVVRAEVEAELAESMTGSDQLAALVAARSLWDKDGRLRDSVFATMQNVLAGYADLDVASAAEVERQIDFSQWLSGDNTIYVVATAHEQARLRPVLTVLVQQAIRAAYDTAASCGGTLRRPCLVLLDEAGNIAPLRDLPGYASTARSHGISLVTVWQDIAQIRAHYRDRAATVLNNHRARLFGTGIADDATLEYLSRLIGDVPVRERNLSGELNGGGRRSFTEHTSYRRAAPIDALRRLRTDQALLLYGSELPAPLHLRPWFDDHALRTAADRPDLIQSEGRSRARLRR